MLLLRLLFALIAVTTPLFAARPDFPPARPEPVPLFHEPRGGGSLDSPWEYVQGIYDVDTLLANWRNYLNAIPVGMGFSHSGRGYLATLHTVFRTTDGGRTWRNLDNYPPPGGHASDFASLRSPRFISGLAVRPVARDSIRWDSLYVTAYNTDNDSGYVRLLRYEGGQHRLFNLTQLGTRFWLTNLLLCDSTRGFVFGGLDGELYKNDSLQFGSLWRRQNPYRAFLRSGREDSLFPVDTWVTGFATAGNLIVAAGSHQWISRDGGQYWRIHGPADELFDLAVHFSDSLHGVSGGGTSSGLLRGWVHVTDDAAYTWSERVLDTDLPVRAVLRLSPDLLFAAGGDYNVPAGKIWSSGDGGETWNEDVAVEAEIKLLASTRVNRAYVDVFAAGVYPDFHGGMWRTRVFLPDTGGAVIFSDPDTLDFGAQTAGIADTLTALLRNTGLIADTISSVQGSSPFVPQWGALNVPLPPGTDLPLPVVFRSDTAGIFTRTIVIQTRHSGRVELIAHAEIPAAAEPKATLLPEALDLTVWPNPSNASFVFRFDLARAGNVRLVLFDVTGREVAALDEGRLAAGSHTRTWHAAGLSSGIYFARLESADAAVTRKLLLLK